MQLRNNNTLHNNIIQITFYKEPRCEDRDECELNTHKCRPGNTCINKPGSFVVSFLVEPHKNGALHRVKSLFYHNMIFIFDCIYDIHHHFESIINIMIPPNWPSIGFYYRIDLLIHVSVHPKRLTVTSSMWR